jgi:class 3 adenylate cyclase
VQRCPSCNEENPDRFRMCGFCGTPLQVAPPPEEVRKTVTIVFCDLKGSTSLGETLDSEALREVLGVYFAAMKQVLERHGGTVEKYIGDAIMAVFGLPRMHEDDALRAVRAAAEMRTVLKQVNVTLQATWGVTLENRTGVNTGEVVAGDATTGQRLATGDTVNVAARLEQAAPPSGVLIGESTYRLVRDAVEVRALQPLELKGKSERVPAYQLISVGDGEAITRRLDLPMVGRDAELSAALGTFRDAVTTRRCQLLTIVAHAGLGKSRLVEELLCSLGEGVNVLRGRCLSYGDGATFLPLVEVVRRAAGITETDGDDDACRKIQVLAGEDQADLADRLESVMGLSATPYGKEEYFWAARAVRPLGG